MSDHKRPCVGLSSLGLATDTDIGYNNITAWQDGDHSEIQKGTVSGALLGILLVAWS